MGGKNGRILFRDGFRQTDCGLASRTIRILDRARVAPDRPALFEIATGRQLTDAGLDARIARCAGFLTRGVRFPAELAQRVAILAAQLHRFDRACLSLASASAPFTCRSTGVSMPPRFGRSSPIATRCSPDPLTRNSAAVAVSVAGAVPQMTMMSTTDGPEGLAARIEASHPAGPAPVGADAACILPPIRRARRDSRRGVIIDPPQRLFRRRQFFLRRRERPRFGCPVRPAVLPHYRARSRVARTTSTPGRHTRHLRPLHAGQDARGACRPRVLPLPTISPCRRSRSALRNDPAYSAAALAWLFTRCSSAARRSRRH